MLYSSYWKNVGVSKHEKCKFPKIPGCPFHHHCISPKFSGFLLKQEQSNSNYFQRLLPRSLKVKRKGWQGSSNSNAATPTRELPIYKEHYPECHALASITLKNTAQVSSLDCNQNNCNIPARRRTSTCCQRSCHYFVILQLLVLQGVP